MSPLPTSLQVVGDNATASAPTSPRTTKAPAFQLYAADFQADPRVMAMTWEQRGVYTWLLLTCWNNNGELPADHARLSRMLNIPRKKFEERVWPAIASCFEKSGDIYAHPHLTEQRAKHDAFRAKQAMNGAKGGRPRKGLGFSGESQTEANKSSSSSSPSPTTAPSPSSASVAYEVDGAAAREVTEKRSLAPLHIEPPTAPAPNASAEPEAWLAPIRAVFEARGATWYAKVAPELLALRDRGIPAERVARAARVMFDAPGLTNPGPRMLGVQFERWDGIARAAERWDLYKREGLTETGGVDVEAAVARVVARGESPSREAFIAELRVVNPARIIRLGLDREGNIREVAKRLGTLERAA